jgi:hypothetical protein
MLTVKRYVENQMHGLSVKSVHTVLAYAASFMLSGMPVEVCESTLTEMYCSVKKSLSALIH